MKGHEAVVLFIGLCCVALPTLAAIRIHPITIPAMEIVVLDKETKKPAPNIILYYNIDSVYYKSFLFIPNIFRIDHRELLLERYVTDADGKVFIPSKRVWIKLFHEDVASATFFVNFDVKLDGSKKKRMETFMEHMYAFREDQNEEGVSLNKKYKMVKLSTQFCNPPENKEYWPSLAKEPFEELWYFSSGSFNRPLSDKTTRHIVIELPRWGMIEYAKKEDISEETRAMLKYITAPQKGGEEGDPIN